MNLPIHYNSCSREVRREAREQYRINQSNKCYYCGGSLLDDPPKEVINKKIVWYLFPENFLAYPIHLHHDHETGMTLGAVHAYCNAILWQYEGE